MDERKALVTLHPNLQVSISLTITSIFFREVFSSDWTWLRRTSYTMYRHPTGSSNGC